jgi:hypothetical protein
MAADRVTTVSSPPEPPFWRAALLLIAASILYCAPLFFHLENLGREDWDQFSFRYDTARVALLRDHQIPSWNPYASGGNVLLAHPDSPVTSPLFLIVLALGAPIGLRVQVLVFMALGSVGMAALTKRLGASTAGSIAGGLVFMMSAHFALHITEGHLEWCVLGVMPWLAIALLRLDDGVRYTLVAGLLLAIVVTFGAVYIPAVFLPFFSVWIACRAIAARTWAPLVRWANVVVLAGLLASVKLLPMVAFTGDWPREAAERPSTPPRLLLTALLDPRQALLYQITRDRDLDEGNPAKVVPESQAAPVRDRLAALGAVEGFQEYGWYFGYTGLVLAVAGLAGTFRKHWMLYVSGACALLVVFGSSLPVDLWTAMRRLPLYGQLQVPSRFLAAVVFVAAIAAACGLDVVAAGARRRGLRPGLASAVLVALLAGELALVGWPLFNDIFVVPPLTVEHHDTFAQRFTKQSLVPKVMSSTLDVYLRSNSGSLEAYENLAIPTGNIRVEGTPAYRGEAYLERADRPVVISTWTMARVTVQPSAAADDRVILNQNFYRGWTATRRSRDGSADVVPAERTDGGLIAVPVTPAHREIELFYVPAGFEAGAWISGVSLVLCLAGLWFTRGQ